MRGTFGVAIRLLRRCGEGEGPRSAAGFGFLLAGSAATLLQPWPLKLIVDDVLTKAPAPPFLDRAATSLSGIARLDHRLALLALLCAGAVLIQLVIGAFSVLSTSVLVSTGLRMVFRLRCALFDRMQRLSLRFHDANPVGDSLYRVTWDTYAVQTIFNTGLVPAAGEAFTLLGIAGVMLQKDWSLTLAALSAGIPIVLLIRALDRPMSDQSSRVQERESEVSSRVQETLSGIRVVQAFGGEERENRRFRQHAGASLSANLRLTVIQALSAAAVGTVLAAGTGAVVWIAARRVLEGRLTPGDVVLMSAYVGMLYRPFETLAYTAAIVQGAVAKGRRVFAILDAGPDVTGEGDAAAPSVRARGGIVFENVSFAYDRERPVLRGVSLDVPAGTTVALVGPSGAGKTTLASLLPRFYDPDAGRVLLDGRDLRSLPLEWLRRNIAIVLQEPVLFAASIAENIAYGRPDASAAEVSAAAEAAGVAEFARALPGGLESEVGERGVTLSGGQRQRISIARAFLKDAPVLIMDEPTSALDASTEARLLEALERLKHGRTTLIIAHRLSTIREAGLIVSLRDGRVEETGSHAALSAANGLYARLHAEQHGRGGALAQRG
jgi:ABC-type multidrug transport system fused ATPase/permease subunit